MWLQLGCKEKDQGNSVIESDSREIGGLHNKVCKSVSVGE